MCQPPARHTRAHMHTRQHEATPHNKSGRAHPPDTNIQHDMVYSCLRRNRNDGLTTVSWCRLERESNCVAIVRHGACSPCPAVRMHMARVNSNTARRSALRAGLTNPQPRASRLPCEQRWLLAGTSGAWALERRKPTTRKGTLARRTLLIHACGWRIPTPSDAEIGGGRLAGGIQGLTNQREGPTAARRLSIRNSTLPRPHPFCATDRTSLGNWRRRSQSPDGPRKAQRLEPKRCAAHVRACRMSWCLEAQAAGSRVTG